MSIAVALTPPVAADVEIAVLGAFQARTDGDWHTPPTRQIARVGTMLAGWPGEVVELDRLIAGVWGDKVPTTVRNTLQVHVSHLRRLVGRAAVRSGVDGYALDVPPEAVDAGRFVEAIQEAARLRRREHFARAAEILERALELWRGTPFPDVTDADLDARRARLAEVRDQGREDLLECRLETCHDHFELADIVADAVELTVRRPLREKGHVLLVRALAAADRPAEASAAFEAARIALREAVGLDPGRALVDAHARGLARDESVLPRAMRSVRVLPDAVDPSREDDAQAAAARVREAVIDLGARLVTVVAGAAECADLASAIGVNLADDMPTGVVVVPAALATVAHVHELASHELASHEHADTPDIAGLAVVVAGSTPHVEEFAAEVLGVPRTVLVLVADRPIGLSREVVLWGAAATGAATTEQGA